MEFKPPVLNNLDRLLKKPTVKPHRPVLVHIKEAIVDKGEEAGESNPVVVAAATATELHARHAVVLVDKRKQYENDINREMILKKIAPRIGKVFLKKDLVATPEVAKTPFYLEYNTLRPFQDTATIPAKTLPKPREQTIVAKPVERTKETTGTPLGAPLGATTEMTMLMEPIPELVLEELEREMDAAPAANMTNLAGTEQPPVAEPVVEPVVEPVEQPVAGKKPRGGKKKAAAAKEDAVPPAKMDANTMIQGRLLSERLPKPATIAMHAPAYYMTNRKLYVQKLSELMKDYNRTILSDAKTASCDDTSSSGEIELMTHQKIVRDYLNLYTPYRGLLLYHGLGSGKTCTSIAVAEGMKSHRRVIVMTPASLATNFFEQLKKCGDSLYRRNQFWEFISTEGQPEYVDILSQVLSLSREWVIRNRGAWLVDISKKTPNYQDLDAKQQKQLDAQIDAMISTKYTEIHYNGFTKNNMDEFTRNGTINPFDNSVVLIDEAHNFVSRIVNKLKKPASVSYQLYVNLMSAQNARVVLMSGTPIINYPNEIGIMFNILRGFIKTWSFQITSKDSFDKDAFIHALNDKKVKTYDYVDYTNGKLSITRNPFGFINGLKPGREAGAAKPAPKAPAAPAPAKIKVQTVGQSAPPAIEAKPAAEKTAASTEPPAVAEPPAEPPAEASTENPAAESPPAEEVAKETEEKPQGVLSSIMGLFGGEKKPEESEPAEEAASTENPPQKGGNTVHHRKTPKHKHKKTKIVFSKSGRQLHRQITVKKRSNQDEDSDDELSPFTAPHIDTIVAKKSADHSQNSTEHSLTFSPNSLKEINQEAEDDLQRAYKQQSEYSGDANPQFGGDTLFFSKYNGMHYSDEQGNISDDSFLEKIKSVLSSMNVQYGQIVQETNYKCLPDDDKTFLEMFVDADSMMMTHVDTFKRRILGLTSYFRSAQETLLPSFVKNSANGNYHIVNVEMSDYQFSQYSKIRTDEMSREKKISSYKRLNPQDEISSTYRIFSRSCCNFAFPAAIPRPMKEAKSGEEPSLPDLDLVPNENLIAENDALDQEDVDNMSKTRDISETYVQRIQQALIALSSSSGHVETETNQVAEYPYLSREGLRSYSPKYLKILENIESEDNVGLHLLYSNFRTMEGIGIFKMVLEANGFAPFKIRRQGNVWEMDEGDPADANKPRFALYTGTETAEEKEILRNIYNSNWELVPASIADVLRKKTENNYMGEVIKLLMITASGAEGINLENTRFVHIMEPYWHMVRVDQVVGRARRICSHKHLPVELRTVKVFLYMACFTEAQKKSKNNIQLMLNDVDSVTGIPQTTDQSLYEIAGIKDALNSQILRALKETAMDCSLYASGNKEEKLVCYGGTKTTTNDFISYPSLDLDLNIKDSMNVREERVALQRVEIKGVPYAFNPSSEELYDWATYENTNQLSEVVGHLKTVKDKNGKVRKMFVK